MIDRAAIDRFFIILMLCSGFCCWVHDAKGQFAGSGTNADPYLIETAAQLANLAELVNAGNTAYNDKCYKLENNIDLFGYGANFNGGRRRSRKFDIYLPSHRFAYRFGGCY
jgi:hypothetical protein